MLFNNESFVSEFEGISVYIQEHTRGVFRIDFADERNPLTITRIFTVNGPVWISIPQGRKREALLIGEIIEDHFKRE